MSDAEKVLLNLHHFKDSIKTQFGAEKVKIVELKKVRLGNT